MKRRWPGWDGWLCVGASAGVCGVVLARGLEQMSGPLLLLLLSTAAYLLLTRALRRPPAASTPTVRRVRPLIVVPTHDNAGTIREVTAALLALGHPVLVVDDGSRDGSGPIAEAAGAALLTHPHNLGKGAAIESALAWAAERGFSHIVTVDADGQHLPDDVPGFVDAIRQRPEAVIAGARDSASMPSGARYARANSNFWVWVGSGRRVADTQCGLRAYPVGPIRALALVPSRYQWEVEVLVRAAWAGIPIVDHPCRVYYPPAGERVSSYRKVVDTLRISWLNAHLIAERVLWPPRWFPASGGWRGAHRGTLLGWSLYLLALGRLGPRPVKLALRPLVAFYWLFLGAQRRGLDAYLRRRLPDLSRWGRARARYALLSNFADGLVDRFDVLLRGTDHLAIDRDAVPGLKERLEAEAGSGLVVLSGHLGNADFASALLADRGRRAHLLLYGDPDDPYLRLVRDAPGAPSLILLNDAARHASLQALRVLRDGEVVAMKGDRVVDERRTIVSFLGEPMALPTGPLLLAALADVPVLFVGCFRVDGDRWRIEADGPHRLPRRPAATREQAIEALAARWAATLEAWTERYPLQWYNFHDPWSE